MDLSTGNKDAPPAQVNLKFPYRNMRSWCESVRACLTCSAHRKLDPCEQVLRPEWLANIIIGAGVPRCGPFALPSVWRDCEDRHLTPLPKLTYHLYGAFIVGLKIEQDDVGPSSFGLLEPFGRSRHLDDSESLET